MKIKICLLFVFIFVVAFKVISITRHPLFNPHNDSGLFWTESALQYRTAKHIARNGYLPGHDPTMQYPEGVNIAGRLTILMESISGYIYYCFVPRGVPFHVFLIVFIAFFSSLSVLVLYHTVVFLIGDRLTALMSTILYAATPAHYTTIIAPGFEYQDFALPILFLQFYCFTRALKANGQSRTTWSLLSGTLLFSGFAAWHMTQFYYTLLVIFVAFMIILKRERIIIPFYYLAGSALLAGLLLPTQQNALLAFSLPMLGSYALILTSLIPKKHAVFRIAILLFLVGIASIIFIYLMKLRVPEYRMVYGLLWDKVFYLARRPSDPTGVPWETLVMWVSPFTSPSLSDILRLLGALAFLGLFSCIAGIAMLRKKETDPARHVTLFFSLIFLPLYLMMLRLDVFLIWFWSAQVGVWICTRKILRYVLIIACFMNGALLFHQPQRAVAPDHNYLLGMFKYIRKNIPEDAAILTNFAYGPSIIAYTGHPVSVHSKFESEHVIKKIKEFEHALFESEKDFYNLCHSHRAAYFVYQTDMLLSRDPESMRFRTHNLSLTSDCAAFKFHFEPEHLLYFELCYTNPHYRIYRVGSKKDKIIQPRYQYYRVYDKMFFDLSTLGIE